MKQCNETITVFNKKVDEDKGYDIYCATVISGVSWHCDIASNVDATGGLKAANKFIIRIPVDADCAGKEYVDSFTYSGSDPNNLFTLANGDIIVQGVVSEPIKTPNDLKKAGKEVVTILGVTDSRKAPRAPHLKVIGA
ncbi:MAG: hypothetical protein PHS82_03020 [Lachnospiraceae bacterium]|nr:hypothetical protein [Lachnospiraceae bacterium]